MSYIYAQIDENNICIGISEHTEEIKSEQHIQIDSFDLSCLNRKYDNGEWKTVEIAEEETEPTDEEIFNSQVLLNQMEILSNQEAIDETLAVILLGQQTV